jgi:Flp pilus assembly protein TadB
MGRKSKQGGGGGQRPVKGFRPGKEPAHLRRQQAKAQLGKDATASQKRMVDLVSDRTPEEVHSMVNRWIGWMLAAALLLIVGGGVLYRWSMGAGVAVLVLAVVFLVFAYRMHRQRPGFVEAARTFGRRT